MLNSAVKRFVLPFLPEKHREPLSSEVESAAVYALAEFERTKGSGLLVKQPEEKLLFIVEIGYPIWLFPKGETTYIIDGLDNFSYTVNYLELPLAIALLESLEKKSKIREDYLAFLSDNKNYFQQSKKEKAFSLRGLIADLDFKRDFSAYIREAIEATSNLANLALLPPTLEEATISSMLAELDKLQSFFKEDAEKLQECLRLVSKTTSQYITELDYAIQAVKDETNAKIRAQEELVNPKIAQLTREYKQQIANTARTFDEELESYGKLEAKTEKSIETCEQKIKLYQREAKSQAQKKHLIYEKRWKEKSGQAKKELDEQKKELKRTEKNITNLKKQKTEETYKLQSELEAKIRLARQPLLELEVARNTKILAFRQEAEKLIKNEKLVINVLNSNIKLRETINAKFEMLGIIDQKSKNPTLFYVPFYVACYRAGLAKRYILLTPSKINAIGFAAKLKGALGMSKIRQLLIPRFQTITELIDKVYVAAKQNPQLDDRIRALGERNNLLNSELIRHNMAKGIAYLRDEGWLSDRECSVLNSSLTSL
jgi:hypothetical protein